MSTGCSKASLAPVTPVVRPKTRIKYKNNEYKVIDSLQDKNNDTKERAVFRAVQKRDLIKTRAKSLRLYYIQTFPDDEHEKIEINNNQSGFQLDPMLQRGLRWLGF